MEGKKELGANEERNCAFDIWVYGGLVKSVVHSLTFYIAMLLSVITTVITTA